jgi:UDP-N-acetyl-D-glucosamine dehydrogenase
MWRVVEAAATKPFGFMPFFPGPGIGGHCIPLDPMYLSWKAKSFGFFNRFIELATDINGNMPRFVLDKLMRILNKQGKHLKGSRVLVLGVAYKPGVSDTRESPGLEVLRLLNEAEADVTYHDPFVPTLRLDFHTFESVPLDREYLQSCDCVLLATAHAQLDLTFIAESAPLILDTRNAFSTFRQPNIVSL